MPVLIKSNPIAPGYLATTGDRMLTPVWRGHANRWHFFTPHGRLRTAASLRSARVRIALSWRLEEI